LKCLYYLAPALGSTQQISNDLRGAGANIGLICGVIAAGLVMYFEPFGPHVPGFIYFIIIAITTLFGSWDGGLYGVATKNQKLSRFDEDIEAGKYLILIYARNDQEETVKTMMATKHREAAHVASDRHFANPFSVVRRIETAGILTCITANLG